MIHTIFLLLTLIFLAPGKKELPSLRSDNYAIHDVNIIDVEHGLIIENQTLIIDQGLITEIMDSDQYSGNDSTQTLDYGGSFVVPGLIDAHVHLGTNPSADDNLEATRDRLHYLLMNGVTTVRDMAGDTRYLGYLSRQAALDEISSPDIYFSALLAGESFFADPRTQAAAQGKPAGQAPWMRAVTADTDLNQVIAEAKGTGATGIKIYADLDVTHVQKIVRAAHVQDMKVWAHSCVFPARPSQVCEAGVDVMSHATYLAWEGEKVIPLHATHRHNKHEAFSIKNPAFPHLIQLMNSNRTILDATISVYKKYFPDSTLYQYGVSLTRLAYEHGVKIGVGTDLSLTDLSAEAPIIQEMSALQEDVRMKPIDIIRAATLTNAEMIGEAHRIGSVEVGKRAHLLLLKDNPMKDINHLRDPEVVIKNGKIVNSQ